MAQQKKELELKNSKLKASEQEIEKQNLQRNFIILGLIGVLAVAVLLMRSVRQQKKTNAIISKQKRQVEEQKDMVEAQKEVVEEKNHEIMASINYAKKYKLRFYHH